MGSDVTRPLTLNDISPKLINDLALGLYPPSEVFARHGYTEQQAAKLVDSGVFASALKEAKDRWNSTDSAEERIRLKALIALEELMPYLFAVTTDLDTPPTAKNEIFKSFQRLAGVDKPAKEAGTGGPGFHININLGDGVRREVVVEPAQPAELAHEGD